MYIDTDDIYDHYIVSFQVQEYFDCKEGRYLSRYVFSCWWFSFIFYICIYIIDFHYLYNLFYIYRVLYTPSSFNDKMYVPIVPSKVTIYYKLVSGLPSFLYRNSHRSFSSKIYSLYRSGFWDSNVTR